MVPERHTIFQVWHIRPLCHLSENRVAAVFGFPPKKGAADTILI
mgnify:CR=1 FL=1